MGAKSTLYLYSEKRNSLNTYTFLFITKQAHMKRKCLTLLPCLLATALIATAQTKKITGNVIASENNEPVIGASIVVKGTRLATITDLNGHFALETPDTATTLTVSYLGMKTLEASIREEMNLRMEAQTQLLEEIVVVGYGTQMKQDVTGSIAQINGENLRNLASPSFESQLGGRAAGVLVTTPSGMVGETPVFQIRGFGTLTSGSQPLFLVDGVPVVSGNQGKLLGRYNALGDINPNDIQSVEILKDGAATAIYGSRAANGVVLISTRKGSAEKVKVTYDAFLGTTRASKLHRLLNADEFVRIANEKYENKGETGPARPSSEGVDTDWNQYVFQTAPVQSHSLAASGGTPRSQYYASAGYARMGGIIRGSSQERYTLSAQLGQKANSRLHIGLRIQAAYSLLHGAGSEENTSTDTGFASVRMFPNVSPFNPEDPTGYNIDAANRKALGRGPNLSWIDNGISNIVWVLDRNLNRTRSNRLTGNAFAEINLTGNLTLRTQLGADHLLVNDFLKWDPESGDGYGYGGLLREAHTLHLNRNLQNQLHLSQSFGTKHHLDLTTVQEYTRSDYEYTEATAMQLSDPFFSNHILSDTFGEKNLEGDQSSNGLASYLLRAHYNYDGKYYLSASLRRDGLSKLPPKSRWGTFAGASLAWRPIKENFRLRAGIATVGNSDLGSDYPYLGAYSPKDSGAQKGIGWSNMGNENLQWESTQTFDLGLDGNLFQGKLGFEAAYFLKNTQDLVMEVPTPPTLGIPGNRYYDNVGKIKNSGVEISLIATPLSTPKLSWRMELNLTFVKNKVTELYNHQDIHESGISSYVITREGESFQSLYGFEYYGVNPENGNPVWYKNDGSLVQFDTFGSWGYAVYDPDNPADVSQASELSPTTDRKILGASLPSRFGGFNHTLTSGNFDLNVLLRFSGGNKIMNVTRQKTLLNLDFANNGKEILGRWQSRSQPGDGQTPRIGYGENSALYNIAFADSHFIEDGSYLKLSLLSLGYVFPGKVSRSLDIDRIRLYLQAQNLLTLTPYSGLDPETSTQPTTYRRLGVDWDGMPQQRIFTFGANILF
jgi:TonB-linked SusC/RagA family outer membrane protein